MKYRKISLKYNAYFKKKNVFLQVKYKSKLYFTAIFFYISLPSDEWNITQKRVRFASPFQ